MRRRGRAVAMADMEELFGSDADSEAEQKGAGRRAPVLPSLRARCGPALPCPAPARPAAAGRDGGPGPAGDGAGRAEGQRPRPGPAPHACSAARDAERRALCSRAERPRCAGLGGVTPLRGLRDPALRRGRFPSPQRRRSRAGEQKRGGLMNPRPCRHLLVVCGGSRRWKQSGSPVCPWWSGAVLAVTGI